MNAGGHVAVALGLDSGPPDDLGDTVRVDGGVVGGSRAAGFLLGTALPDLSAMGGFRLLGATPHADVARGITMHHRSDEAFHRHPWFTGRNRALATALAEAGIGRGPARACAHVGIELLLDGELLGDESIAAAVSTTFDAIGPRLDGLAPLVLPGDTDGWRRHLARIANHRLPDDYDDPGAVAERLHRILRRRPRLALDAAHIETVASALREIQPSIRRTASALVVELQTELQSA